MLINGQASLAKLHTRTRAGYTIVERQYAGFRDFAKQSSDLPLRITKYSEAHASCYQAAAVVYLSSACASKGSSALSRKVTGRSP